jgi:hypothetical protein
MVTKAEEAVRGSVIDGLTVREFDAEPYVLDVELAERLGYERPRDIRKLIKRLLAEGILCESDVCATVAQTSVLGGRPTVEYWLNESGALDVALASQTPTARAMYRTVKQVFIAWRHGHLGAANDNGMAAAAALAAISATITKLVDSVDSVTKRVSFIETHVAQNGVISDASLKALRNAVRDLAELEHAVGKWPSVKAARRDIDTDIGQAAGWGGASQPWKLAPAYCEHKAQVRLRARRAAILREANVRARDRQTKFEDVPDAPPAKNKTH